MRGESVTVIGPFHEIGSLRLLARSMESDPTSPSLRRCTGLVRVLNNPPGRHAVNPQESGQLTLREVLLLIGSYRQQLVAEREGIFAG